MAMRSDILIVGQGLAGTLLGWEFERAGLDFAIADPGHAGAASAAGAGIINPITGRRLVKSWRIDELLPLARAAYAEIEAALDLRLWHDLRMRRLFADERERTTWQDKHARGELAPFGGEGDESGFWVHGAARIDLGVLLAASRARWLAAGRFRTEAVDVRRASNAHQLVVDCSGLSGAQAPDTYFRAVPWEFSKGEILGIAAENLAPDVIVNCRLWLLPMSEGVAWVGATQEPGVREARVTDAARTWLEARAGALLGVGRTFEITGQRAGIRVHLPDKRPVAGRSTTTERVGIVNGLGAKGALWAPLLARCWVEHLRAGRSFEPEIDVRRFAAAEQVKD
jgi:glycine/D-amino acid oxidase-like deaminating enzyme